MRAGPGLYVVAVLFVAACGLIFGQEDDENRRTYQNRVRGGIKAVKQAGHPLTQITYETGLQRLEQANLIKVLKATAAVYDKSVKRVQPWPIGTDEYNATVLIHEDLNLSLKDILSSTGKSHQALQIDTFKEYTTTITIPTEHMVDEMHFTSNPNISKTEEVLRKFKGMCTSDTQAPDRLVRTIAKWFIDQCPDSLRHRVAKVFAYVDELVNQSVLLMHRSGKYDAVSESDVRRRQQKLTLRLLITTHHARRRTVDFINHMVHNFNAETEMGDLAVVLDEAATMAPPGPNVTCKLDVVVANENFVREAATRALSIIDQDTTLLSTVGTFCIETFYTDPAVKEHYLNELQTLVDRIDSDIPRKLQERLDKYWPAVALSRAKHNVELPSTTPITLGEIAKHAQELLDIMGPDEITRHTVVLAPKEYATDDRWYAWTNPLATNNSVNAETVNYRLFLKKNGEKQRMNSWLIAKAINESQVDLQRVLDGVKDEEKFWPKDLMSRVFVHMVEQSPVFKGHLNDVFEAVVFVREYDFWSMPNTPRYGVASAPQAWAKSVPDVEAGSVHLHGVISLKLTKAGHWMDGDKENIVFIALT